MKMGKVTKSEVMELCPLLSSSSIEKVLAKMVKEGKLEKTGSGKNTFYIIKLQFSMIHYLYIQYASKRIYLYDANNRDESNLSFV